MALFVPSSPIHAHIRTADTVCKPAPSLTTGSRKSSFFSLPLPIPNSSFQASSSRHVIAATLKTPAPEITRGEPYTRFDDRRRVYSTHTEGVIDAPLEKVWAVLREFGNWDMWWGDTMQDMRLEPEGQDVDAEGLVRTFRLSNGYFSEQLLKLDEKENRIVYSYEDGPQGFLRAAITTVDLDQIDGGKTRVYWSCLYQPVQAVLATRIGKDQKAGYDTGTRALQKRFAKGDNLVSIEFLDGEIRKGDADYILVTVGDDLSRSLRLSRQGAPTQHDPFTFYVESIEESMQIIVMDRKLGSDKSIGTANVPLAKLAGAKYIDIPIRKGEDEIGSFRAAAYVSPPLRKEVVQQDNEENIGKVILAVGKDLFAKVMDISLTMAQDAADGELNTPYQYASFPASLGPLPKYCKVLPGRAAIMPKRTGMLFQRSAEYIYSQVPLLQATANPEMLEKLKGMEAYAKVFNLWVEPPKHVIENYYRDEEIAAQLIRGVNPVKIAVVNQLSDIPLGFHGLRDPSGRSVQELIDSKSLYCCDYWENVVGEPDPEHGSFSHQAYDNIRGVAVGGLKYWYAPILVVYKDLNGKLNILGIQLTRHTDKENEVYTKEKTPDKLYRVVKLHLACADNQHHQFVTHLGIAHLAMEPLAVATNNAFPPNPEEKRHPIGKLLHPHFQDTIGINFLARQTLVSEVAPFTNATFSPGTENGLKICANSYAKWDFFGDNFVNALKRRGFDEERTDGLPGYYYRDDGFLVWNAFKDHFASIIDGIYESNSAVAEDSALQGWCDEIRDPSRGGVASFPSRIETKVDLVEVITTIVFYCSAQHAAVNYPQIRYESYVPNHPASLLRPVPPTPMSGDIEDGYIEDTLPPFFIAEFQALFSYFLTTPPDNPFSIYDCLSDRFPEKCKAFKANVERIHWEIVERNKKLVNDGEVPYEYMDLYNLPQSINI